MSATLIPWSAVRGAAPPPISQTGAIAHFERALAQAGPAARLRGQGGVVRVIYVQRHAGGCERFHCMYAPPPVAAVREILRRLTRTPTQVGVSASREFDAAIVARDPAGVALPAAFVDGLSVAQVEAALNSLTYAGWTPNPQEPA